MKFFGRYLTILFGALPATYLCSLALIGIIFGFGAALDGETAGLLVGGWGLAGIYGTLSLWAVGFGFVRTWSVIGLTVGLAALTPITGTAGVRMLLSPSEFLFGLVLTGPVVVAIAWLGVLTARSLRQGPTPGNSSKTNSPEARARRSAQAAAFHSDKAIEAP